MEPLNLGPVANELKSERIERLRPDAKQCKSRLGGLRCMKPVGHKGQHGHQVVRVVRSARWD